MNRDNSCQSDSSGFLDDPLEPLPLQVGGHWRVGIGVKGKISRKHAMPPHSERAASPWKTRTIGSQGTGIGVTLDKVPESLAFLSFLFSLDFAKQGS